MQYSPSAASSASSRSRHTLALRNTIGGVRRFFEHRTVTSDSSHTLVERTASSVGSSTKSSQLSKFGPDFLELLTKSHGGNYKLVTGANAADFYRDYFGDQAGAVPPKVVFAFTVSRSGKKVVEFYKTWRRPTRRNSSGQMLDRAKKAKRRKTGFLDEEFDKVLGQLDSEFKRMSTAFTSAPEAGPSQSAEQPAVSVESQSGAAPSTDVESEVTGSTPTPALVAQDAEADATPTTPPRRAPSTSAQPRPQSTAASVMSLPFLNAMRRPFVTIPTSQASSERGPLKPANPDPRLSVADSMLSPVDVNTLHTTVRKHGLSPLNPNSKKSNSRKSSSSPSSSKEKVNSAASPEQLSKDDAQRGPERSSSSSRRSKERKASDNGRQPAEGSASPEAATKEKRESRKGPERSSSSRRRSKERKASDNERKPAESSPSSEAHIKEKREPRKEGNVGESSPSPQQSPEKDEKSEDLTPSKPQRSKSKRARKESNGQSNDESPQQPRLPSDTGHELETPVNGKGNGAEFVIVVLDEDGVNSWHGLGADQLKPKSGSGTPGVGASWWAPLVDQDELDGSPDEEDDGHSDCSSCSSEHSDGSNSEDEDAPVLPWKRINPALQKFFRRPPPSRRVASMPYKTPIDPDVAAAYPPFSAYPPPFRHSVHRASSEPAGISASGPGRYASPFNEHGPPNSPVSAMAYHSPYAPMQYLSPVVSAGDLPAWAPPYSPAPEHYSPILSPHHYPAVMTHERRTPVVPTEHLPSEHHASPVRYSVAVPAEPYSAAEAYSPAIPPGFVPYSSSPAPGYAPPVVPYSRYGSRAGTPVAAGAPAWAGQGRVSADATGFPHVRGQVV